MGLVCAEILLLVPPGASRLLVLDSTRLLARAAFDTAIGIGSCRRGAAALWWADDAARRL